MMTHDREDPKRRKSGKSPTKFMERPGSHPETPEPEEGHPEFLDGELEILDQQEKPEEEKNSMLNELGKNPDNPAQKVEPKPDPRNVRDPEKQDSGSDDAGDCACP